MQHYTCHTFCTPPTPQKFHFLGGVFGQILLYMAKRVSPKILKFTFSLHNFTFTIIVNFVYYWHKPKGRLVKWIIVLPALLYQGTKACLCSFSCSKLSTRERKILRKAEKSRATRLKRSRGRRARAINGKHPWERDRLLRLRALFLSLGHWLSNPGRGTKFGNNLQKSLLGVGLIKIKKSLNSVKL